MKKNENGFGLVEGLLIFVIIGILGAIGWYVVSQYKMAHPSESTIQNATTQSSKYTQYVNKEFGFKFSYPAEWGKVSISKSPIKAKSGQAYDILFGGGLNKYGGGFHTRDWVPLDASDTATGFISYDACKKSSNEITQVYLYESDIACVSVAGTKSIAGGEGDGSDYANIILQTKFVKNKNIAGIEMHDAPVAVKGIDEITLKKAYDYQDLANSFVKIAKTTQEL